jgi:hypothetical protein
MPRYLIIGPADGGGLTQFWSQSLGDWVDRDNATLYDNEIWLFPPRELPVGGRGILDILTQQIHTPLPGRG